MTVDDEVAVGRIGVQAVSVQRTCRRARHVAIEHRPQGVDLRQLDGCGASSRACSPRRGRGAELDPWPGRPARRSTALRERRGGTPGSDRGRTGRTRRLEVHVDDALDGEERAGQRSCSPAQGPAVDHQAPRGVAGSAGGHPHAVAVGLPRSGPARRGAGWRRPGSRRRGARRRTPRGQEAGIGLVDGHEASSRRKPGKRAAVAAGESSSSQARPCWRALAATPATTRASGAPTFRPPVIRSSCPAAVGLKIAPQSVGPLDERDVLRGLVVGLPDDPAAAVRSPLGVAAGKGVEAEHPLAPPGDVVGGGAAHAAETKDDGVVGRVHVPSFVGCPIGCPVAYLAGNTVGCLSATPGDLDRQR